MSDRARARVRSFCGGGKPASLLYVASAPKRIECKPATEVAMGSSALTFRYLAENHLK